MSQTEPLTSKNGFRKRSLEVISSFLMGNPWPLLKQFSHQINVKNCPSWKESKSRPLSRRSPPATTWPVVDVIIHFGRKSGKSGFPPKLKQQEYAILKVINSFKVYFCIKLALFSHFSAVSDIRTNFFKYLIFGKSRFPPKKIYNIDYRAFMFTLAPKF